MNNRIGFLTFAFALMLSGVLVACNKVPSAEPRSRAVTTSVVSSILPARDEARYTAAISPVAEVELSFKTSGYVAWIDQRRGADGRLRNLDAGDSVVSGAPLARLRPTESEARSSQANASVQGAYASRAEAEAQLQQTTVEAQHAEIDWGRAERLFQQSAMTQPDHDSARTRYEVAQSQLENAKAAISLQRSRIEDAVAQRREKNVQLEDIELHAPFRGVILARNVEKGSLASIGGTAFVLADIDHVKLTFAVPDIQLPQLHLGLLIPVRVDVLSTESFVGTVTMISPAADPQTSTFQIEVTIGNPNHQIRPGMIASVGVPSPAAIDASTLVIVAISALIPNTNGRTYSVFVLRDEGGKTFAHRQTVEIGRVEGNNVTIRSGLRSGLRVVLEGNNDLVDGEAVSEIR
ncbi:RND family efflux transporter MFP subunit [Silvibacterium bohemicum]|uniref:RND family efflux transporter MFP subunit n=1 Tax=Silvibacterium bohemicum TaxID=1577686 RepID=A0A841KAK8_9BACT|nr:efflux RND transporter periplasmic adaptor subunit [Silvibacterium bohemicum]MBB6147344.1 RND family efflux transporter MFP subunit [Silvibacterium bohemicum]